MQRFRPLWPRATVRPRAPATAGVPRRQLLLPVLRTGVDLAGVADIAQALGGNRERYLRRVYTPQEIDYALSTPDVDLQAARLAARFAAKEAAIKALGLTHLGVSWTSIEVVRDALGQPILTLHDNAQQRARALGVYSCSLSLSHDGPFALACVTLLCCPDPSHSLFKSTTR
ncbi:holo-[acyl-carrier protein] synthase [Sphaerotilus hippei]|uniref:Holo-[acyl-carrier-protein] synthase n=1 Tax=Sphaerotilus hippei TaxID=744406 RepID=A0A318H3K5_9BURK|nr:holo-ACP synthase [Sphaerotilus hippei]PXW98127.1 holo-[acyl-carrier protein] synthase [Sphaerotilus hippei]